jgi:MFS family permease
MRILGFSLVLSVIAVYANRLVADHGPHGALGDALIGLATGAYAITLALLQLPLGWLSDRVGRKPVLLLGVALFAFGCLISAFAPTVEWLVLGRVVEGTGAVSSAAMAFLADVVAVERRATAMTLVGIPVAVALMGGLVVGPLLAAWITVPGIFAVTAGLALLAEVVLVTGVREPPRHERTTGAPTQIGPLLRDPRLLRANLAAFTSRFVLMTFFVTMPVVAGAELGIPEQSLWRVLLVMILVGAVPMAGLGRMADRGYFRAVATLSAILLVVGPLVLLAVFGGSCASLSTCPSSVTGWAATASVGDIPAGLLGLLAGGILFFGGFAALESLLPALVTTVARPEERGLTTGVFNSLQFVGSATGALAGATLFGTPLLLGGILAIVGGLAVWAMGTSPVRALGRIPRDRGPRESAKSDPTPAEPPVAAR